MPNIFDSTAFVEFRQTDGTRRRVQVWLPEPVPTRARNGPAQIAGIHGRWQPGGDAILLEQPVTPEMGRVIADMAEESLRRAGMVHATIDPRDLRWDYENVRLRPTHERLFFDQVTRSSGEVAFRLRDNWSMTNVGVKPPPRAPQCACGDRKNKRWEHHSGGCAYLDPDVADYDTEEPGSQDGD